MISVKNSFEIAYNGTENECRFELYADTASDLQGLTHIDGIKIQMGSECTDIATGDKYILNGSGAWILQPSQNAFSNVYTKPEIDSMITEIYDVIAYYHTTLISDTGEIAFYSLGGNVGKWAIYGNGKQTGTPTPDNPVMPTFCGVRTDNLAPPTWASDFLSRETPQAGFVPYIRDDYLLVYARNGFGNYDTEYLFKTAWKQNTQYTFCITYLRESNQNEDSMLAVEYTDGTTGYFPNTINDDEWHTTYVATTANKTIKYLRIRYSSGSLKIKIDNFYVYEGTEQQPFEPYGYKLDISCAGQTVPVYLGEVPTVRRVKKLVLTGTKEDGNSNITATGIIYITPTATLKNIGAAYCTHFKYVNQGQGPNMPSNSFTTSGGAGTSLWFKTDYTTVTDFKAYLASEYAAGHPVTVWYVLANEQTDIVNEPLCKIGTYADELHSEDAGVSIPTVKGSNTLTVETELQPSLIEISGGYHA